MSPTQSILRSCITEMEARLARGNDAVVKAKLGKFYLYTRDLARSREMLQDAAGDLPNLPLVWFNLGEVFHAQGVPPEALANYERAAFLDSRLPCPHLRIGQMADPNELRLAAQRWARMKPITAAHNGRLYRGIPQQIDDLLPTTLIWYVSPCEASDAYAALTKLHPRNKGYTQRAHTCEELPDPHRF